MTGEIIAASWFIQIWWFNFSAVGWKYLETIHLVALDSAATTARVLYNLWEWRLGIGKCTQWSHKWVKNTFFNVYDQSKLYYDSLETDQQAAFICERASSTGSDIASHHSHSPPSPTNPSLLSLATPNAIETSTSSGGSHQTRLSQSFSRNSLSNSTSNNPQFNPALPSSHHPNLSAYYNGSSSAAGALAGMGFGLPTEDGRGFFPTTHHTTGQQFHPPVQSNDLFEEHRTHQYKGYQNSHVPAHYGGYFTATNSARKAPYNIPQMRYGTGNPMTHSGLYSEYVDQHYPSYERWRYKRVTPQKKML